MLSETRIEESQSDDEYMVAGCLCQHEDRDGCDSFGPWPWNLDQPLR